MRTFFRFIRNIFLLALLAFGVWTYKNTWYWGAGAGVVKGNEIGFNIGYGFGDTSNATENMVFYNGKAHKLEDVKFNIPLTNNSIFCFC